MVKNELEQREGLLLPVPRRIAVLSRASNSREIQPPKACGCVHSVHLRSLPILCQTSCICELDKQRKWDAKPVHVLSKSFATGA